MATGDSGRYLLDSHAFLWLASENARISNELRDRLAVPTNELWLSAASIWELAIKKSLGKLTTAVPLGSLIRDQCEAMAVTILDVQREHALGVEALPLHHRDPFDRLLVAQAICEGLELVSVDEAFDAYPVTRVW